VARAANRRVRFLCRTEVLFCSQVKLHAFATEPAASAGGKLRRLGEFLQFQKVYVEATGCRFFARWHGELYVIDRDEGEAGHGFIIDRRRVMPDLQPERAFAAPRSPSQGNGSHCPPFTGESASV